MAHWAIRPSWLSISTTNTNFVWSRRGHQFHNRVARIIFVRNGIDPQVIRSHSGQAGPGRLVGVSMAAGWAANDPIGLLMTPTSFELCFELGNSFQSSYDFNRFIRLISTTPWQKKTTTTHDHDSQSLFFELLEVETHGGMFLVSCRLIRPIKVKSSSRILAAALLEHPFSI